jgi:hypothetical protein
MPNRDGHIATSTVKPLQLADRLESLSITRIWYPNFKASRTSTAALAGQDALRAEINLASLKLRQFACLRFCRRRLDCRLHSHTIYASSARVMPGRPFHRRSAVIRQLHQVMRLVCEQCRERSGPNAGTIWDTLALHRAAVW